MGDTREANITKGKCQEMAWARDYNIARKCEKGDGLCFSDGWANGKKDEPFPGYIQAPCEEVIKGQNNTIIVLGRDRPHNTKSGYGGAGHSHAGAIRLCAGVHGSWAKQCDDKGNQILADPNFVSDAATIYLSQKTDIDYNFGLSPMPGIGSSETKAGIGIKADHIRIVARESIAMVTMTDDVNAQGGTLRSNIGIALNGANRPASEMEPLVKGYRLETVLARITDQLQDHSGLISQIATHTALLYTLLTVHTHTVPALAVVGGGGGSASGETATSTGLTAGLAKLATMQIPLWADIVKDKVNPLLAEGDDIMKSIADGSHSLLSKTNYTT